MTETSRHLFGENERLGIIVLDAVLINVAFYVAYVIRYELQFPYPLQFDAPFFPTYAPSAVIITIFSLISYNIDGLYDYRRRRRWSDEAYRLTSGAMTSIVLVMALTFLVQAEIYSRGMLVLAGGLIVVVLGTARIIRGTIQNRRHQRGLGVDRVLVVGAGEVGRAVMRTIIADPSTGYRVIGYVDDAPEKGSGSLGRIQGLGSIDHVTKLVKEHQIDEVLITLPWRYYNRIVQIVTLCEQAGVRVRIVPDIFQQRVHRVDLETLNGIPLMGPSPRRLERTSMMIKRLMDLGLSLLVMPFLIILYIVVGIMIKLDSPGPIIFKQKRVGKDGHEFYVLKFRTMIDGADAMKKDLEHRNRSTITFKDPDDPRRTRVGRWLRATSLDELPQFINVLRGEMSIVGPRPGTPEEVARYQTWQLKRTAIQPGITGLWQVSGRSDVPFEEMCLLDIFYIENWSLDLDLRIMLKTIPVVLFRQGAY
ncbi:MAG: sugar transferase [Chloroflexi bacterium]|nr:sugar transferase [Chloroflexota bacterium]